MTRNVLFHNNFTRILLFKCNTIYILNVSVVDALQPKYNKYLISQNKNKTPTINELKNIRTQHEIQL